MRIETPSEQAIIRAADAIKAGKLVVIPTETVYGLAADATNRDAVQAIFDAKGRPNENPLIVHIGDSQWLDELVEAVPDQAQKLAEAFWPGPLTLVLRKQARVLDEVTAGLGTVAVRMPSHPVALEVILAAGVPIAAPSANKFTGLSPTRADHVDPELANHVELIIDGGPCEVGLESTVLDCSSGTPRLLRPGRVSKAEVEQLLGIVIETGEGGQKRSPGMYLKHYAPKTPTKLVSELAESEPGLTFNPPTNENQIQMPTDPRGYASSLYQALHTLDQRALDVIAIEAPPQAPDWDAVWDRLKKAAY